MSLSKFFLYLCLSFIAGISFSSFSPLSFIFRISFLVKGIFFIFLISWLFFYSGIKSKICLVLFCGLIFLIGYDWHQERFSEKERSFIEYGQEISFEGMVVKEPERRVNQQKFQFQSEKIPGLVLVTTSLYPVYQYGDQLNIKGKLVKPPLFDDFNYEMFLAKNKIYSLVYYPKITLLAKNQGKWFYQVIFNFKSKIRRVIHKIFLPPESAVLKAVLLGDKYELSEDFKEKLNITGTRHLVAISGLHMVIMTQIFLFLALGVGLWRQQAFYLVVFLLGIYIVMVGAPSSSVRAGIMAFLLLFAQKVGRLRGAGRAVVFAATAMLVINPLLLASDVGFQLSFMATLSIIYLKPILDRITDSWPNPFRLKDVLTMTLAAQIGVLPLLIYHFRQISLISPLVNLIMVPLLPFIMMGGIGVSLGGLLIGSSLMRFLAWPLWLILSFFTKTIALFASLPLIFFEVVKISWIILGFYYLALILVVKYQNKFYKLESSFSI